MLQYPNFENQFTVESDASDVGLGAVLTQGDNVIAYASRSLTASERNYSATEKECLGVVWSLNKFGMYLEGRPFTVITDHKPLIYLQQLKEPRGKLARWRISLENYDFNILHRPGQLMTVADALSRAPVNVVRLEGVMTEQEIIALQREDTDVQAMREWVKTKQKPRNIKRHVQCFISREGNNLKLVNNVLVLLSTKAGREVQQVILPQREASVILQALHDEHGHFDYIKTKALVGTRYFWFNWKRDVYDWCRSCTTCLQRKCPTTSNHIPVGTLPIPNRPFECWHMDFAGPLPKTPRGNRFIFALTDPLSKWVEAFAVQDQSARTTADVIYQEIVCRYGIPVVLHSDQGTNFESKLMKELHHRLGIRRSRSAPYNPRCNGQIERMNRTMAERLAMELECVDQTDWDVKLPTVLAAIRNTISSTTQMTPYSVVFGSQARNKTDWINSTPKLNQERGNGVAEFSKTHS